MKAVITIFALPQELEDLAQTLERLKRNSVMLDGSVQYKVELTMCLSDELTDWDKSSLPKDYIQQRTEELFDKYTDWCSERKIHFETDKLILGCVSQRRESWKNNPDADFFLWLDCDMFFRDDTLFYLSYAARMVKQNELKYYVITPEFVKQWDDTWDVIVNKKYHLAKPNYHLTADIHKESLTTREQIDVHEIPTLKFAGGWLTVVSKSLLDEIGIPESFGHYGLEDTFVMVCSDLMKRFGIPVYQLVLSNLIAGELHKSRTNETIKKFIVSKDRKEEFKQIAHSNWEKEVRNFIESVKV